MRICYRLLYKKQSLTENAKTNSEMYSESGNLGTFAIFYFIISKSVMMTVYW
jgi:hypothetical protein